MQDKGVKENFIKKSRCIMIVIMLAGILPTACVSRGGDEAEQESQPKEQDELQTEMQSNVQVTSPTEYPPEYEPQMNDDDIPELVFGSEDYWVSVYTWQDGQRLSKDEWETETTLSDITWDDYHSGNYETWLYFSFNNGVEIDKELQYSPSIVEYADFVDITGDGADEVLIYRYFANTATEYTLINFFKIEENSVTEISPELELEELADDVWNVVDADFSEEEYGMPVFTMESYVKENMLVYLDKRVLVGYQDGGWHILEWFDCPEPDFE